MSANAVCIECGSLDQRLGQPCRDCGGPLQRHETPQQRLRAVRREVVSRGLAEAPHIGELPRELIERTRRELEEKGVLPSRGFDG